MTIRIGRKCAFDHLKGQFRTIVGKIQIGRRHPTSAETSCGFLYLARRTLKDNVPFLLDASFHFSNDLETGVQFRSETVIHLFWKVPSNYMGRQCPDKMEPGP